MKHIERIISSEQDWGVNLVGGGSGNIEGAGEVIAPEWDL